MIGNKWLDAVAAEPSPSPQLFCAPAYSWCILRYRRPAASAGCGRASCSAHWSRGASCAAVRDASTSLPSFCSAYPDRRRCSAGHLISSDAFALLTQKILTSIGGHPRHAVVSPWVASGVLTFSHLSRL